MKRITIPYFPTGLKYVTPFIVGAGIYLLTTGYPSWAGVLIVIAIIILTTKYVIEINLDENECRDFLFFLWIPFEEEKIQFSTIDKIVITKANHSQTANTRSRSRQIDWASFTGTLILDQNKTLDLLTRNDKGELIEGIKEFAEFLKVDIEDQTTSRHYFVDMARY